MTILLELDPETEERLKALADREEISPEQYAGKLLDEALTTHTVGTGILTPERFDQMLTVLTKGSESRPILSPEVNERASYYEDRL